MSYFDALCEAMSMLAAQPGSIFVGQAVESPGTAMFTTLRDVPNNQRLEFPVAEDFQMGFCTGASLNGFLPICIFPRFNFLLLAMNQLVLHLDKLPLYSPYRPKVIIRTAVATPHPLDPGPQHLGDYTIAMTKLLETIHIDHIDSTDAVVPAYRGALARSCSSLIIERTELYGTP